MCLTLPETLITVMGIEKVLPTWSDLEVFLQLLPRSSTGERMNPYTSAWTGVTPGDGPQAFHLVLLDNGRTAALTDPVGRSALHCIRCSACLNVCPVYERAGGHAYGSVYPGPIGAVLSPQLTGVEDNASLPYASSLCGACFDACPVRIDIPSLLVQLRAAHVDANRGRRVPTPEALGMAAAAWVMADPQRFAAAEKATRAGRLLGRAAGRITTLPPPLSRWTASRDAPRPPAETFREWWARARGGRRVSAREEVLRRIRAANAAARPTAVEVPRDYHRAGAHPPGAPELVELLRDRLVDYRATVLDAAPDGIPAVVARALAEHPGPVLVPSGLPDGWCPDGVPDRAFSPAELDRFAAVVTGCAAACAETGTIALDGSPDQGRRALTLVPDVHVCVVRAEQVVHSVPELIAALTPDRPTTFISGPSATSDIELERVEGVHGPRTLIVVLVH